jgi:hypothetical protein
MVHLHPWQPAAATAHLSPSAAAAACAVGSRLVARVSMLFRACPAGAPGASEHHTEPVRTGKQAPAVTSFRSFNSSIHRSQLLRCQIDSHFQHCMLRLLHSSSSQAKDLKGANGLQRGSCHVQPETASLSHIV